MDANLLRIVTRDSKVRKVLTNGRVSIDKSRPMFETSERCTTPMDLFSRISEMLLTVNPAQRMRPNTR